jgi:hypothetical protein
MGFSQSVPDKPMPNGGQPPKCLTCNQTFGSCQCSGAPYITVVTDAMQSSEVVAIVQPVQEEPQVASAPAKPPVAVAESCNMCGNSTPKCMCPDVIATRELTLRQTMPISTRIETMMTFANDLHNTTKSKHGATAEEIAAKLTELTELGALLIAQHDVIEKSLMTGVVTKDMMQTHLSETAAWFSLIDKLNIEMTKSVTQSLGVPPVRVVPADPQVPASLQVPLGPDDF